MRPPNLTPESGAEFFGKIECLEDQRLFRASCYAQLQRGEIERDAPSFWMCATQSAAEKWIEVQAAQRGFPTFTVVKIYEPRRSSQGGGAEAQYPGVFSHGDWRV
jgi:hypothetical protein